MDEVPGSGAVGAGLLDVSVIVPFKNQASMTLQCLATLAPLPIREILLVDNRSEEPGAEAVEVAARELGNARVVRYNAPFNFQRLNNWAVTQTSGRVVWLLNNDVEVPSGGARVVRAMYEKALEPALGAVGCVLLYGDGRTVQHAGVYLVPGGLAAHLYWKKPLRDVLANSRGRYPYDISSDREFVAVTAASVMVERTKYDSVGGLNPKIMINSGDVDLCLRLREQGYASVLVGASQGYLIHKESKSRSAAAIPYVDFAEGYRSYIRYFDAQQGDPFVDFRRLSR